MHWKALQHIVKIQLIQEREGELIVRIVKDGSYTNTDEKEIATKLLDSVNDKIKLDFEYVTNIESTARGKHRLFLNKLSNT